ncbi:MAG: carbonic anhydrase [Pseudonocardiales bacterium]|nr:carbonic anhydrase [Pseudonocardiales bacterium]MBV9030028.1 carbonic anhydrase [Pseudonocardiales bacterium]
MDSSVAASLEYAVSYLAVPSILVCGHSGCAAMHGLLDGATSHGSLGRWLRWGLPSLHALRDGHPVGVAAAEDGRNEIDQLSMVNVACQVEVIGRHSAVRGAVAAGRVQVPACSWTSALPGCCSSTPKPPALCRCPTTICPAAWPPQA